MQILLLLTLFATAWGQTVLEGQPAVYASIDENNYWSFASGTALVAIDGSYDDCESQCDSRSECWGFQTAGEVDGDPSTRVCQSIIVEDNPMSHEKVHTNGQKVWKKTCGYLNLHGNCDNTISVHAECAEVLPPMTHQEDEHGTYVELPTSKKRKGGTAHGAAWFVFSCTQQTDISFRAEVLFPHGGSNSFFVLVDNHHESRFQFRSRNFGYEWHWAPIDSVWTVAEGCHFLVFDDREPGAKLANVEIVQGSDVCTFHSGVGTEAENAQLETVFYTSYGLNVDRIQLLALVGLGATFVYIVRTFCTKDSAYTIVESPL